MAVTGVIVEIEDGAGGAVLNGLAGIENVSVYGIKENKVVTVIEGRDMSAIDDTIKGINAMERVIGVFPVYSREYE